MDAASRIISSFAREGNPELDFLRDFLPAFDFDGVVITFGDHRGKDTRGRYRQDYGEDDDAPHGEIIRLHVAPHG